MVIGEREKNAQPTAPVVSASVKLDVGPHPSLVIGNTKRVMPSGITVRIDDIWHTATSGRHSSLFNGVIFCVHAVEHDRISVFQAEYKQYYAQIADPLLYRDIDLHPLACSGALTCQDGIIVGKRSATVAVEPNLWELAPAGTFDEKCVKDDMLDATTLLLNEAEEELGIPKHVLQVGHLLAVFRDEKTKSTDLILRAHAPISETEVHQYFEKCPSPEYAQVKVIKPLDICDFLEENRESLNSIARAGLALLDI